MKGLFIVLEGIDGSGKGTQTKLLSEYLKKRGRRVLLTSEPSHSVVGAFAREQLQHRKMSQKWMQLLFAADRQHHVENDILPALKAGKTVICDRYSLSSLAYGSVSLPLSWLKKLNHTFPRPDLTIILDVPAEVGLKRVRGQRRSLELYERKNLLAKVRRNYLALAKGDIKVVDASGSKKETFAAIKMIVDKL
ncbi:dTMP kinase [Candidatus Woesearchaeota archaeon]|nr:dTMP kinase [Candidatus Woesearchaeota archaeon]